jgi:hypothetical protein
MRLRVLAEISKEQGLLQHAVDCLRHQLDHCRAEYEKVVDGREVYY